MNAVSLEEEARRRKQSKTLALVGLDEFVVRPQVSWHVRDLIPAASIVLVFGAPKSGKTFTTCDLIMHAAHRMLARAHHLTAAACRVPRRGGTPGTARAAARMAAVSRG